MKIKNISNKDLSFSLNHENAGFLFTMRPNQVMYCESEGLLNKQILIYERKRLVSVNKEIEKPDYVDYYKCFFEAGEYSNNKVMVTITVDDDADDEGDASSFEEEVLSELMTEGFDEEDEQPAKRGRGRPKKPVTENPSEEKKKRGRPKGSIKK